MSASSQKQLNVRSTNAHRLAHVIADRLGVPVTEAVTRALSDFQSRLPPPSTSETEREAAIASMSAFVAKYQAIARRFPDTPADHDWLYDDDGLPI